MVFRSLPTERIFVDEALEIKLHHLHDQKHILAQNWMLLHAVAVWLRIYNFVEFGCEYVAFDFGENSHNPDFSLYLLHSN